ncbi:hypothetical protein RRG08_018243 [Elysia crispata]|uniref:Uncharacterized protein n=1 Tax=Elysia crispata TaxID=231223 RepID=A0AAE1AU01_9GAST|nr:hypothetical protein RRG08_018243 [Elysia crispata]
MWRNGTRLEARETSRAGCAVMLHNEADTIKFDVCFYKIGMFLHYEFPYLEPGHGMSIVYPGGWSRRGHCDQQDIFPFSSWRTNLNIN